MPTMIFKQVVMRYLGVWIIAYLIFNGSGCGKADTEPAASTIRGGLQKCLEQNGAVQARGPDDLDFVTEALSDDEISKPGFSYDRETRQLVSIWTAVPFESQPPEWLVWFAQPLTDVTDREVTPMELTAEGAPGSYVYYSNGGPPSVRQNLEQCVHFGGNEEPPVKIHVR